MTKLGFPEGITEALLLKAVMSEVQEYTDHCVTYLFNQGLKLQQLYFKKFPRHFLDRTDIF